MYDIIEFCFKIWKELHVTRCRGLPSYVVCHVWCWYALFILCLHVIYGVCLISNACWLMPNYELMHQHIANRNTSCILIPVICSHFSYMPSIDYIVPQFLLLLGMPQICMYNVPQIFSKLWLTKNTQEVVNVVWEFNSLRQTRESTFVGTYAKCQKLKERSMLFSIRISNWLPVTWMTLVAIIVIPLHWINSVNIPIHNCPNDTCVWIPFPNDTH